MTNLNILDATTLSSLRELGGDEPEVLLDELFGLMFASADTQIAEIRAAAAAHNLDRIMRAAHLLKGGAGSIGAQQVAFIAGQIEADARAGRQTDWYGITEDLQVAIGRLRVAAGGLGLKTAA